MRDPSSPCPFPRWSAALLAGILCCIASGPAAAQSGRWDRKVDRLEAMLEAGEWKRAMERAESFRSKLVADVEAAEEAVAAAARTWVVQAVAEANLGRDEDAVWHWLAAQNFLDGLPALSLEGMGRAREVLRGRSLSDTPESGLARPLSAGDDPPSYDGAEILHTVRPEYPRSVTRSGIQGSIEVQIVVDVEGRPRRPRVSSTGLLPTMAFPALEGLRQWRFEPATEEDRRIPVLYTLELHYP